MSPKRDLQAVSTTAEQRTRALDGARLPRQIAGWCSVKRLAVDLDFVTTAPTNPEDACRNWLRKHHIVGVRRGRVILVSWRDVEAALRKLSA